MLTKFIQQIVSKVIVFVNDNFFLRIFIKISKIMGIMSSLFNICIKELKNGKTIPVDIDTSPDFLEIIENDLIFSDPISIKGQIYLTNQHMILQLSIDTKGQIPCSICNAMTSFSISIQNFTQTEDLENIKLSTFNYAHIVREEILLAIPSYTECSGTCPWRPFVTKYMKKKLPPPDNFPFADL